MKDLINKVDALFHNSKINHIITQIFNIIIMSVMIFMDILIIKYGFNLFTTQMFSASSIMLLILFLVCFLLSLFIIFVKWDYRLIIIFLLLVGLYF